MKKVFLLTILLTSLALAQNFTFEGIPAVATVGEKYTITITADENTGNANLFLVVDGEAMPFVVPSSVNFGGGQQVSPSLEFTYAGTGLKLRCVDPIDGDVGESAPFDIDPGTPTKWLILAPGETESPGTADGKTGDPSVTAGEDATYTIKICDKWYNEVTTATGTPSLSSTDSFAVLPASPQLGANTIQLRTVEVGEESSEQAVTVSGNYDQDQSSVDVNVGEAVNLLILCQGEEALQGDNATTGIRGKTGEPVDAFLGSDYLVEVRAVDACWNMVPTYNDPHVNVLAGSVDLTADTTNAIANGSASDVNVGFKNVNREGEYIGARDSKGLQTAYSTRVVVQPGIDSLLTYFEPPTVPVGVHSDLYADAYVAGTPLEFGYAYVKLIDGPASFFHLSSDTIEIDEGTGSVEAWADTLGVYTVEVTAGDQIKTAVLTVQERPGVTVIPNPFKYGVGGATDMKFSYKVAEAGAAEVVLLITDVFGNIVYRATYTAGEQVSPGTQEIVWDGTNSNGNRVASGMYQAVMKITLTNLSSDVMKKNFMVIW